jgi:hypothetical protein
VCGALVVCAGFADCPGWLFNSVEPATATGADRQALSAALQQAVRVGHKERGAGDRGRRCAADAAAAAAHLSLRCSRPAPPPDNRRPHTHTHILLTPHALHCARAQSCDCLYGVLVVGQRVMAVEHGAGTPAINAADLLLLVNFVGSNASLRWAAWGRRQQGAWGAETRLRTEEQHLQRRAHALLTHTHTHTHTPLGLPCICDTQAQ